MPLENRLTSTDAADLELMRVSMQMDTDPAAAARGAGGILQRFPGHEGATLLLATACRRIGDPGRAIAVLQPLAVAHPDSPIMQLELGRVLSAAHEDGPARAAIERALALSADLADAWRELATLCFRAADEHGGDAAYLEYSRRATEPPELADAYTALYENRLDTAEARLVAHLQGSPRDIVALRLFANLAMRRNDLETAERKLAECLAFAPGYAAARYDLVVLLSTQQRTDEALPLLDRLLATDPGNRSYRIMKSQALRLVRRNDEACALMESVIADHPDDPKSLVVYGHLLREVGNQPQAIDTYRRALALDPGSAEAWWSLANLKTFRFSEPDRRALAEQTARAPALGKVRTNFEFSLGKAFEDAKLYAESFEHYQRGNWLQRGTIDYSPELITADVRRSEAIYTPRFFAERSGWGLDRPDAIFVVGVPRSGSTLLEQILASHSQIEGTHELPDMPAIVYELALKSRVGDVSRYPESIADLSRADIQALAERYLARTSVHRPLGRPRFVDKMLPNFSHVGLIHLLFPRAAIIDARRHPLACGFSCFKQLFAHGIPFSYNLEEMGRFYRDYHELMAHMDAVLPGRVHRVHYEALIAAPEVEVRRMLDYCGLPFEERCMRFYDTPRTVMTISSEQVRQPIYADSVEQWRHYERWLEPLREPLGDLVRDYPVFAPARR